MVLTVGSSTRVSISNQARGKKSSPIQGVNGWHALRKGSTSTGVHSVAFACHHSRYESSVSLVLMTFVYLLFLSLLRITHVLRDYCLSFTSPVKAYFNPENSKTIATALLVPSSQTLFCHHCFNTTSWRARQDKRSMRGRIRPTLTKRYDFL